MSLLHDPATRDSLQRRLRALTPASARRWGRMSVDQMLWHLNAGFDHALGRLPATRSSVPRLPGTLLKLLVFNLPWPRGRTPTSPTFLAAGQYDFDAERVRTQALIDEMFARSMDTTWPPNATLGPMSGRDWSRLMAKHVDHHLRQFGV
jgi:hypothetical protein